MRNIGEILVANVQHFRSEKGWSQGKLAEEADVHINTIQKLESSTYKPRLDILSKVATAFGVSPYRLLISESESQKAEKPTVAEAALEFASELKKKEDKIQELESKSLDSEKFLEVLSNIPDWFLKRLLAGKVRALDWDNIDAVMHPITDPKALDDIIAKLESKKAPEVLSEIEQYRLKKQASGA